MPFFKIKPNFEFLPNYHLQLHGEQLSILHSQLLTRLLYHMSPNMVYTRILGSRQIGNYLAGLSRQIAFHIFFTKSHRHKIGRKCMDKIPIYVKC